MNFFRKLQYFLKLCFMDTDNPHNFLMIDEIRRQAMASSLKEAYLESAPQMILQIFLVNRIIRKNLKTETFFQAFRSMYKNSH
jgi:hypothetical protein